MQYEIENTPVPIAVGPRQLNLRLRRFKGSGPRDASRAHAVLFVHGGNSRSDTFCLPEGGVVGFLWSAGYDVWLLDWRASPFVLEQLQGHPVIGGSAEMERSFYNLDRAAEDDFPAALARWHQLIEPGARQSVVAHCLGAGVFSMAIGCGALQRFALSSVVLSTLGLFFEVPWNGWMKAEDFILERVVSDHTQAYRWIDPRVPREWPPDMESAYERWPKAWNAPGTGPDHQLLQRLTFMVGRPFAFERIHPRIRGELLQDQFGPMHLGLYLHASQNIRRGYAAPFNAPNVIDRPRRLKGFVASAANGRYFEQKYWFGKKITLIGGAEDQVWHRDSLDLMYEWLRSLAGPGGERVDCRKHVVHGYRLQELYWAMKAPAEVYPLFLDAL